MGLGTLFFSSVDEFFKYDYRYSEALKEDVDSYWPYLK